MCERGRDEGPSCGNLSRGLMVEGRRGFSESERGQRVGTRVARAHTPWGSGGRALGHLAYPYDPQELLHRLRAHLLQCPVPGPGPPSSWLRGWVYSGWPPLVAPRACATAVRICMQATGAGDLLQLASPRPLCHTRAHERHFRFDFATLLDYTPEEGEKRHLLSAMTEKTRPATRTRRLRISEA